MSEPFNFQDELLILIERRRRLRYSFLTFAGRSVRVPHLSYRAILYYYLLHLHEPSRDGKTCKRAHEWRRRGKHLNLKGSKFGVLSGPKKKFAVFSRPPHPASVGYLHEKSALRFFRLHTRDAPCARRVSSHSRKLFERVLR